MFGVRPVVWWRSRPEGTAEGVSGTAGEGLAALSPTDSRAASGAASGLALSPAGVRGCVVRLSLPSICPKETVKGGETTLYLR